MYVLSVEIFKEQTNRQRDSLLYRYKWLNTGRRWYTSCVKTDARRQLLRKCTVSKRSRDSSVGIATSCRLDDRRVGVRVPVGSRIFSSSDRPDRLWGPPNLLPIQCVPRALSPGVKRPGREVDHSPPTSAVVRKMWIYTSTPPYAFMA
jgi:hypothetical protein